MAEAQATLITSNEVELEHLKDVKMPSATASYQPVSHYDLTMNIGDIAGRVLNGMTLVKSRYGLAREGNQMFGTHTFKDNVDDEIGLAVGFRNSYDKSMSVGIAVGARVFVCENLMMNGDITIFRKHTGNILDELNSMAFRAIFDNQYKYQELTEDKEKMKKIECNDDKAFSQLGRLYGKGILTERQLPVVKDQWDKPWHKDFKDKNQWSFYNACTESLKSVGPQYIMQRHMNLHKFLA